jgi:BTB/POZ domain-containing protein KCTD9
MRGSRLPYQESYELLQQLEYSEAGAVPPIPDRRPRFNDEGLFGVRFFRTFRENGKLENLTLPRTYIGKSEFQTVSFANTDLNESVLCWNDFNEVNFADADLSECDLRTSIFRENSFVRANLRNADLRRSRFKDCDFTNADMQGAKLTRMQGEQIHLSDKQQQVIDWQDSDGEEPPGG